MLSSGSNVFLKIMSSLGENNPIFMETILVAKITVIKQKKKRKKLNIYI